MSVLVTTVDGYHIFTSSGKQLSVARGSPRRVASPRAPTARGSRSIDRHEVWSARHRRHVDAAGEERRRRSLRSSPSATPCSRGPTTLGCCGSRAAGVVEPLPGFDTVAGRDSWHPVGIPLQVRTMTATCDGGAVLVERARRWHPAFGRRRHHVDTDARGRRRRAPGARPPDASRDRGGRGVGRAVPQSSTAARRGRAPPTAWRSSYAPRRRVRGRRRRRHGVRRTVGVERSAVYRAPVDGGPVDEGRRRAAGDLHGNVDSRCIASDGTSVALVDGDGDVWRSAERVRRVRAHRRRHSTASPVSRSPERGRAVPLACAVSTGLLRSKGSG